MKQYTIIKNKNNKIFTYGINPYPFIDYDYITDKLSELELEYVSFGYSFCRISTDLVVYDKLKEFFGDSIENYYETCNKYSYIIDFKIFKHDHNYTNNYKILKRNNINYDDIASFLLENDLSIVKFSYRYLRIYSNDDIRSKMYEYFGQCINTSYDDSTYKYTITIDLELYEKMKL